MPNPKTGTVTTDVVKAVQEVKAGKVEFRVDKTGVIHAPVGKVSFATDKLLLEERQHADRQRGAGEARRRQRQVRKSVTAVSTMGPGIAPGCHGRYNLKQV